MGFCHITTSIEMKVELNCNVPKVAQHASSHLCDNMHDSGLFSTTTTGADLLLLSGLNLSRSHCVIRGGHVKTPLINTSAAHRCHVKNSLTDTLDQGFPTMAPLEISNGGTGNLDCWLISDMQIYNSLLG